MTIGERIRSLRKEKGLSQSELASQLDLKQSTIANYEKGLRNPNLELIVQLTKFFGISTDFLLLGSESKDIQSIVDLGDKLTHSLIINNQESIDRDIEEFHEMYGQEALYFRLFRYVLTKIGWLWEIGLLSISEEHRISNILTGYIEKYHFQSDENISRIVGVTVNGDEHTIGLKMLCNVLSNRHECHFIGSNVPLDDLKRFIEKVDADYLIVSVSSQLYQTRILDYINSIDTNIIVVGYGSVGFYTDSIKVKGIYKHLEGCLEALNE
jgi:transcriptional regulator with XRE-family HTH domain